MALIRLNIFKKRKEKDDRKMGRGSFGGSGQSRRGPWVGHDQDILLTKNK